MEISILLPNQIIDSLEFKHNFTIKRIGYYEKPKNHDMQRNNSQEAILLLCIDGHGYIEHKGKNYTMDVGDAAFLEPGFAHRYHSKKNNLWTILWVHFEGEGIPTLVEYFKKYSIENVFHIQNYAYIADELHHILFLLKDFSKSMNIHKACSMFETTILNLLDSYSNESINKNQHIKNAIDFMKSNIYSNISIKDISRYLGVTEYHFIRIFKSNLMQTPMQYYNSLRINEAANLLLSSDMTVLEISQKLNYNNQFHFSRQFKTKTGISPSVYKKLM